MLNPYVSALQANAFTKKKVLIGLCLPLCNALNLFNALTPYVSPQAPIKREVHGLRNNLPYQLFFNSSSYLALTRVRRQMLIKAASKEQTNRLGSESFFIATKGLAIRS